MMNRKTKKTVQLDLSLTDVEWKSVLKDEFLQDYFINLQEFLSSQYEQDKEIFPPIDQIFNAFNTCGLNNLKVVILGQDPYHGQGQAHGLSFSVPNGVKLPPSLKNIFKELKNDLQIEITSSGNLMDWSKEGVLLLNSSLTVEIGKPGSHLKKGWQTFTDFVIEYLSNELEKIVFILWGGPAQKKGHHINREKHFVIEAPHPSPLSSYRGFFGSAPFSKTNKKLKEWGKAEVNWELKDKESLF